MRRFTMMVVAAFLFALAPAARAQAPVAAPPAYPPMAQPPAPAAPPPALHATTGYHEHDGFLLQLNGGLGGMSSKASQFGSTLEYSGTAGVFALVLGYAVTDSFVLGVDLWGVSVSDPDVKLNGQSFGSASGTLGLSGFGANLTYYFMPYNFYLSAVPSFGTLTAESGGGTTGESESGFAMRLAAGKEWWVSDNWGIGLNLQYAFSSNKDKGTNPPTYKTSWFGVAFSATYN